MSQVPAGWYTDPLNASQRRYWDGAQWTHNTTPGAIPATQGGGFAQVTNHAPAAAQPAATSFSPTPAQPAAGLAPQAGYAQQGTQPAGGFAPQAGYAQQVAQPAGGFAPQAGYAQQAPQTGYAPQATQPAAAFAPQAGYAQQGAYAPQGAQPAASFAPQAGYVAPTSQPTAFSPLTAYTPAPAQYSFDNAGSKKSSGGKIAALVVGGIVVVGGIGYLVNSLVNTVALPAVTQTSALALDTSAKSDVTSLGDEIGLFYVDHSGPPPTITLEGGQYIIDIPGETPHIVRASSGVAFGGATGTGTTTWCVWVTAADGELKDFQFGSTTGLVPGRC